AAAPSDLSTLSLHDALPILMSSARHLRGHHFGNAVLSRLPITQHLEHDLSWKTCEPRRMQRVDVAAEGGTLHVYNVHLGTAILRSEEHTSELQSRSDLVCRL